MFATRFRVDSGNVLGALSVGVRLWLSALWSGLFARLIFTVLVSTLYEYLDQGASFPLRSIGPRRHRRPSTQLGRRLESPSIGMIRLRKKHLGSGL
jgi:hypothetical protein